MAVRRISDLPELNANYPDADLDKCLLEVSYNPVNKVYQSFYIMANSFIEKVAARVIIPEPARATKTSFGVVKVGNNINVVESGVDKGLISIPDATTSTKGVNKKPGANWSYVATDSSGNFIEGHPPTTTEVDINSEAFQYAAINISYPIGSLFISCTPDPPGKRGTITAERVYGPAQSEGGPRICWEKIAENMSIWNDSTKLGQRIEGSIPDLPNFELSEADNHQHEVPYSSGQADSTAKHSLRGFVASLTGRSKSLTSLGGAHTHTVTTRGKSSVYNADNTGTVRPTSIGVIMWKRIADYTPPSS